MKTECPYCHAGQNVLEDLCALPLPCRKCGQTFTPTESNEPVESRQFSDDVESDPYEPQAIDNPIIVTSEVDWISNPECISAGIQRVANAYFSLMVTAVVLGAFSIGAQFNPQMFDSPLLSIFAIGGLIVFLISLFFWFNGQVQLRRGHPVGTGLHEAIARSLNMSVLAILARVFAKVLEMPLLKGVGGILSMAAFDRLLLYFELLCIELDEEELRQRVHSLSKFYRRCFSGFVGFLLLYLFVGVPLRASEVILFVGLGVLGLALIVFSIRFGALLQAVRRTVEIRLNSAIRTL